MILLEPIYDETIWGGNRLAAGTAAASGKRVGHLYSVLDRERSNRIQNGKYAGQTFHTYFARNKEHFGLGQYEQYPVVVALVDAADNLSIQVHPDDEMAAVLENQPHGKNESWYFIEAPLSGKIYNGCTLPDKVAVRNLVYADRTEEITDQLNVKRGDYVYVAAGTLHALTKGSLVCEIEENSSLTYRFFDYHRVDSEGNSRPLHVEKALAALKPENQSVVKSYDTAEIAERMYTTKLLADVDHYRNESRTLESLTLLEGGLTAEGWECLAGQGILLEPGEDFSLHGCKAMIVRPKTAVQKK